eukprot:NODE_4555_length_771_cov_899.813665_g4396_i0.p1 GENE.NODE_4555_length_771_cov_899.813665_g4396_i0~~NODE_4555_length_771_cov_899.813665_g4396_i0.p1  ORF type:complete len:179 (-),score=47.98 NODE_4555_length_771_cov_899.813665_g4396_i0:167-703(-)
MPRQSSSTKKPTAKPSKTSAPAAKSTPNSKKSGSSTVKKGSSAKKTGTLVKKLQSHKKGSHAKHLRSTVYKIDCSKPAEDAIFDAEMLQGFRQYLTERIKVNGKAGKLSNKVVVTLEGSVINIKTFIHYSKKYWKYLTKRYLKKRLLRDWLRVVSVSRLSYELRYFNIGEQDDEGEEA